MRPTRILVTEERCIGVEPSRPFGTRHLPADFRPWAAASFRRWAAAFGALLWFVFPGLAHAEPAPVEFALLGDPQIGYGPGGEYADFQRFGLVVDALNQSRLTLTVIAGDLVQDRTWLQGALFERASRRRLHEQLLVAGNHDVVDADSLAAFRAQRGPDYYDSVRDNVAFVIVNSETARDRRISNEEFERQWAFIESSLARHASAGRTQTFLVMHRPPFVANETEADAEANWPGETRARLLAAARQHGVRWILAGHLHGRHAAATKDGIQLLVLAGTARSFDRSDLGYEHFRVDSAGVRHEWVKVGPAPREPFSLPGLPAWTPRLFDFSIRHWILSVIYGATAWVAWRRSKREDSGRVTWRAIAGVLAFFAANAQLDLDELVSEMGRIVAKLAGVHDQRHAITAAGLAIFGALASASMARSYLLRKQARSTATAVGLLVVPLAWFCLSAISHHTLGMLVREEWWDLAHFLACTLIVVCATRPQAVRAAA